MLYIAVWVVQEESGGIKRQGTEIEAGGMEKRTYKSQFKLVKLYKKKTNKIKKVINVFDIEKI